MGRDDGARSAGEGVEKSALAAVGPADENECRLVRQAFEAVHYGGGKCTLIGVARTGEDVCLTPRMLIAGRILTGTAFGGCRGRTQLPDLIDRYMQGDIKVDEFVTRTIKLEEINDAFAAMNAGANARGVILF